MREILSQYLKTSIPESIYLNGGSNVTLMDELKVTSTIFEKQPQKYVERAVIYESHGDESDVVGALGTVLVTDRMCEGHFDFFPMLPLAILGQAVAQVGELLVMYVGNDYSRVPLVVEVGQIKSISKKGRNKKFIVPGDSLLVNIEYLGGRFNLHKANADIYVSCNMMASIRNMTYVTVELGHFKED